MKVVGLAASNKEQVDSFGLTETCLRESGIKDNGRDRGASSGLLVL